MGYGFNVGADAVLLFVRRRNKILFELVNSTQMSMACCTDSSGRFMCELLL